MFFWTEKKEEKKEINILEDLVRIIKQYFPELINKFEGLTDIRHQSYVKYKMKVIFIVRLMGLMCEIKSMHGLTMEFNTENVKSEMLPGEPKQCNGVWLYIQNEKETKQIVQELFGDKTETQTQAVDASNLKIEVLNGSGNKQNLEKVTNLLKENGYTISTTGTTKSTSKTTIINRTAQTEETEENLKSILKTENINTGTDTKKGVDFTVIIGKDCKLE